MAKIRVQKIQNELPKLSKRELYALLAYYYPQYKLTDGQNMPYRDICLLLKTAQKQEAIKMYNIASIVLSPHAKDKKAGSKLLDYFKRLSQE